jgi:hypothetical protein
MFLLKMIQSAIKSARKGRRAIARSFLTYINYRTFIKGENMYHKLLLTGLSLVLLAACSKEGGPIKSLEDLQGRVNQLSSLTREVEGKRSELYGMIRTYNNQLPENKQFNIASLDTSMGASEKELLNSMFKEEKDITYNGLLKTIIEKNDEIRILKEKISDLQNGLPVPYVVKRGDTQYEIVMKYLIRQHGLSRKDAQKVAFSTAMIDDILPGNQIWLMYKDGIVGTYVTQGSARIKPLAFQMMARKRLLNANNTGNSVRNE